MRTITGWQLACSSLWKSTRMAWLWWTLVLASMIPMTAGAYSTMMPTEPQAAAALLEGFRTNSSMLALLGPAFDLTSQAGFVFWRVGGFSTAFAGMMAGFGIIRATRTEEEAGRTELLRSGAIGRHAPLFAGVTLSLLGCLFCGVVSAAGAVAAGLPVAGSIAVGLGMTTLGAVFVGIGAVCAQIFPSARSARAWTLGVIFGGLFLLRMMIDGAGPQASYAWVHWLIPLEWPMLARPYADERWWVYLLPCALAILLIACAFALESHRDHQAGMMAEKLGRTHAARSLSNAWGLAWRLQRSSVGGWTLGIALSAMGTGSIMTSMQSLLDSNPKAAKVLVQMGGSASMEKAFYLAMLGIFASVLGIAVASILGRLRTEETTGRAELLLSTAQSRWSILGSHSLIATLVPTALLVLAGASMPFAQALKEHRRELISDYALTGLAMTPGIVLIAGLALLSLGIAPRLFGLIWLVLSWSMFCLWFSALVAMPDWLVKLHPWGYLALPPRDTMRWEPLLVELGLGLACGLLGLWGYRRRDITSS